MGKSWLEPYPLWLSQEQWAHPVRNPWFWQLFLSLVYSLLSLFIGKLGLLDVQLCPFQWSSSSLLYFLSYHGTIWSVFYDQYHLSVTSGRLQPLIVNAFEKREDGEQDWDDAILDWSKSVKDQKRFRYCKELDWHFIKNAFTWWKRRSM